MTKTIQSYQNAKLNAAVKSAKGDDEIVVVMRGQTPEAHAEAVLKHFGFSKADEAAFQEKFGYDLRKNLTDTYRRNDIKTAHKPLGNNLYQVKIPIPKSLLAQIEAVKPQGKSSDVPPSPTTTGAANSPKPMPQPLPTPISPTQNVSKDVSQMTMTEKLEIVINKAVEHLGPEAGEKLKQLITPENLAIMVGTTAALIAVQGVPVLDVIVDAAVLGLAAYSLGSEALSAIGDLADFASKTFNAKTEQDLDEAGKSLAKATATIGVDALAALLIHKGVKSIKAGEIPLEESTNSQRNGMKSQPNNESQSSVSQTGNSQSVQTTANTVSPQLENKILYGERVSNPNSPNGLSNKVIGGHSAKIKTDPKFAVEVISNNADGTTSVKYTTQFPEGNLARIKNSTLAPDSWTDAKIIDVTKKVANSPAVDTRARDGATLHRENVDGVMWEVIKDTAGKIVSSYPTGGVATANGGW